MNIQFNVDYRTQWGESLYLLADIPQLGESNPQKAVPMSLYGDQSWKLQVNLPDDTEDFNYHYIVRRDQGGADHLEWNSAKAHTFRRATGASDYEIFDRWQDQPWDKPYLSLIHI